MEGHFQKAYKNLSEYIRTANLEQTVTKEFADLETHFARVEYTLALPQAMNFLSSQPAKTQKNLAKAKSLKVAGNKLFEQKKFQAAVNVYSEALRFIPSNADDGLSAICFANRSAALFSINKYTECLADIELAVSRGYPQQSLYKLRIRQTKCYQYYECEKFQSSLTEALASLELSGMNEKSKESRKQELEKLSVKPLSKILPNEGFGTSNVGLSECVTVSEDNEFGRFIKATRDVASGDVVLVEKPFCSVTLPGNELTHCNRCQLKVEWTPYPCRLCADVIYCSQQCEETAWQNYHRFECEYMLRILEVNINMGHLSLRSALQPGFETLTAAAQGKFVASNPYENIYNLQGHELERSSQDLFWRTVASIVLANMCNVSEWAKGNKNGMLVLATTILHHLDTFPCNAHEISELVYDRREPYKRELIAIGAGIYQSLSMFNHSCDPSVVRTFHSGNVCVMKALSPIASSEQVYDNYGCLYATHHVDSRRSKLKSQYYFECSCIACIHQWPLYEALSYEEDPTYKCYHCSGMVLPPYTDKCDECEAAFDKNNVDKLLTTAKQEFDKLMAQLFAGSTLTPEDLRGKARKLENYSQFVNRLVFRPYKTLNDCQEGQKHIYSLLSNASVIPSLKAPIDLSLLNSALEDVSLNLAVLDANICQISDNEKCAQWLSTVNVNFLASPDKESLMEVCVDSITSAMAAEKGGATRLELCANLLEGGTTPSLGLALTVKTKVSIPVFALIRPRGGDFLYTDEEFQVMKMDVIAMCEGGIDGIVIGILRRDGSVDCDRCAELIALAKDRVPNIKVTFHRAFDMTSDYERALEDIVSLGCERILTSGLDSSALEGTLVIKKCIEMANDRVIIVPGGGINERNIERILEQTSAKEFHCSARKNEESLMEYRNSQVCMGTSLCSQEYSIRVADEQKLQRILMTAARCWKIVV